MKSINLLERIRNFFKKRKENVPKQKKEELRDISPGAELKVKAEIPIKISEEDKEKLKELEE